MKVICKNSKEYLSKCTCKQSQIEAEGYGGDDVEVIEAFMSDRSDVMCVENYTAVIVSVFNVSG